MHIIGDRLCGEITCQRSVDLDLIGVCDCIACQPVSGSALQFTGRVAREDFSLTTRKLSAYVKVAERGIPRAMSVCGRYNTMIHTGKTDDTGPLSVELRGCAQKHEPTPQLKVWRQ